MTTIAYRDGVLAADSLTTSNGVRESPRLKIRNIKGLLVAGAGTSAICDRFFDWVKAGMTGLSPWEGHDCGNGMIITPDDTILVFGANGPWQVERNFYSMGSGEQIALGAMAHGATAEEAVGHAIAYDVYSGGDIRTVTR